MFIELNKLDAKTISVSTDASLGKAIASKIIPGQLAVEIKLFNSEKNDI